MSQDEALAFTRAFFTANAHCVWGGSGRGDFMPSFPQSDSVSEYAAPPTASKDVGVWCSLYQPLAP